MNIFIEVLGWITAILTILLYLPLVVKTIKTKNTEGISRTTFLIVLFAGVLYVIWGGSMDITPTVVANFAIGILMLPMLFLLLKSKMISLLISIAAISGLIFGTLLHKGLLDINIDRDWFHTSNNLVALIIVIIAGTLIGFSWGPQTYIVIKDKKHSTKNLSIIGLVLGSVANILWILYFGLELAYKDELSGDPGVIIAAATTAVMLLMLLTLTTFKTYNIVKNID